MISLFQINSMVCIAVVPLNRSGSIMHVLHCFFKYLHQSFLDTEVHQSIVLVLGVSFRLAALLVKIFF